MAEGIDSLRFRLFYGLRPGHRRKKCGMTKLKTLDDWVEARPDMAFDLVRIYLGIGLFVRGLYFVGEKEFLADLLQSVEPMPFIETFMLHYIPIAHLGGGFLLALGLLTRTSAAFQIPVLAGAVFVIHLEEGLFTRGQNLEFTALVLFLLVVILVYGGGRMSLDVYMKRSRPDR